MAWHCGWAIAVFKEQNYNNFMAIEICCNSLTELGFFFFFFPAISFKKKKRHEAIFQVRLTPLLHYSISLHSKWKCTVCMLYGMFKMSYI